MYILFREFQWSPSQYYSMGEGEKIVVCAFLEKYMEDLKKEAKDIPKLPKGRGRHR